MKFMTLFFLFFAALSAQAVAVKNGTVDCYFEIASTQNPTKYHIVQLPSFQLAQAFEHAVETPVLKNRLLMGFYPGFNSNKEVSHVAINLTYNSANAGAELPLILNDKFTVIVGRQESDLIGAFLNCQIK